jgi:predicted transposase YdaD
MRNAGELTLDEVLEKFGLTAKWEAAGEIRGEARGKAEGRVEGEARGRVEGEKSAWEKMVTMLKQGYTVDELERMPPSGVPGHA